MRRGRPLPKALSREQVQRLFAQIAHPMDRALFRYNPSQHYVRAVTAYAQVLLADERAYTGYYNWPVLVRLTSGEVIISETGVQIVV